MKVSGKVFIREQIRYLNLVWWSRDRTSVTKKWKELYKNWINDSDPKT
jgi:hypothetical protein